MPTSNPSRDHHYVPRFHLAHFSSTGNKKGKIWVHDKRDRRHEQKSPKSRGLWYDFYSIYLEGNEVSLEVDDFFTKQENHTAPIIKHLIDDQPITPSQFRSLLEFIFMLLVRSPRMRMADTLAVFQQLVDPIPVGGSPAVVRELHNWQVNTLKFYTGIMPKIVDFWAKVEWTLMTVTPTDGSFVTTDNPVVFAKIPTTNQDLVFVPLSPQKVLFTAFAFLKNSADQICGSDGARTNVLEINRLMLEQSKRYIFSREEDFCWAISSTIEGNRQDFLDNWEQLAVSQGQ